MGWVSYNNLVQVLLFLTLYNLGFSVHYLVDFKRNDKLLHRKTILNGIRLNLRIPNIDLNNFAIKATIYSRHSITIMLNV